MVQQPATSGDPGPVKQQDLINRLRDELATIVLQVEGGTAAGLTDQNKIAENLVCGLMRELLGLPGLRNLNAISRANYPAIDLADFDGKVAVQVTATPTLAKVKGTVRKFLECDLDRSFSRLVVYVLTRKQESYSQSAVAKITGDRLAFDCATDILDFRDLLERAAHVEPARLSAAVSVVEAYSRGIPIGLADQDFDPPQNDLEGVSLNLIQLFFPSRLYVADVLPEILKRPEGLSGRKSARDILRHHGRTIGRTLPSDYCVHADKLITFHDLNDDRSPWSWAIDLGTVVELAPREFFAIDDAQERVFRALLRYALQVKLYRQHVHWQFEEGLFAFMPINESDMTRHIAWKGLKHSERLVYERRLNKKDPSKTFYQKHFAFRADFYHLDQQWYVSLTPDWYFSFGPDFKPSRFAAEHISWLKRQENNAAVEKHFRFLVSWIREQDASDMFAQQTPGPTVTVGDSLSLTGLPALPDDEWLPVQTQEFDLETPDLFAGSLERP